jgi:beta-glucosidase
MRLTKDGVSFTIKNVGDRVGSETAFVFYGKQDGVISRPRRQLCAFVKVSLAVGEERQVFVTFDDRTFAYYDIGNKCWQTEQGVYQIEIGASVEDIRLTDEVNIYGIAVESEKKSLWEDNAEPVKKRGMLIHENSTVNDLRYAKGWVGRAFSGVMRFAISFCKVFGKKEQANTLIMGVIHQPVRGLAKFSGMSRKKMEGLLLMFNGKLFKGLKTFLGGK